MEHIDFFEVFAVVVMVIGLWLLMDIAGGIDRIAKNVRRLDEGFRYERRWRK